MLLLWATDVHLNFLPQPDGSREFGAEVRKAHPDADGIVITGDIGECQNFLPLIEEFTAGVGLPVWYILGNHDAYNGSVRAMKYKALHHDGKAKWLVREELVELAPGVALVGHDGWYDARFGEPTRSRVLMSDFFAVQEMSGRGGQSLLDAARKLGDEAAQEARVLLLSAIGKGYKRIFFATHVPPYALATWHQGKLSDGQWLPWMSCRAMGEMLDEVTEANPDVDFTTLCGHTHSEGVYRRSPNLLVLTGHSEYRQPRVCGTFTF